MSVRSPVRGGKATPNVTTSRWDRSWGFIGLVAAVATIGLGLVAQATGYEWLVWVAAGLVGIGLAGVVRDSFRCLLAFDIRSVVGWLLASWLVLGVGLMAAALVAGDSVSLLSMAGLRSLIGPEAIAVSAVAVGVAVGSTSVGLLRGRLRSDQRSHLLASGLLALAGVGLLVGGIVAWLAPVTIGELESEADVVETDPGVFQVMEIPDEAAGGDFEQFEVRAYGYEGTGDPASEGWDRWVVVTVDEATGEQGEILYGPVSEEAASQYIGELDMASRSVLFEGTEAELEAWLQDEGAANKDYLVPAFLVWTGVLFVGSALTLSPRRRHRIAA